MQLARIRLQQFDDTPPRWQAQILTLEPFGHWVSVPSHDVQTAEHAASLMAAACGVPAVEWVPGETTWVGHVHQKTPVQTPPS